MKNKKTIRRILIGLGIAVLLLIAYALVNQNSSLVSSGSGGGQGFSSSFSSLTDGGTDVSQSVQEVQLQNTEILRILGSIQNIELRDDIFSNPVSRQLRDTRFSIPRPARIGRPNPFLPIGFDNVTIQTIFDENDLGQNSDEGTSGQDDSNTDDSFSIDENNQNFFPTGEGEEGLVPGGQEA